MTTTVLLELHIDPAALDRIADILSETLTATRAWPGNLGLEAIVDDADPAHVIIVEQWATTADHDAYAQWRLTPEGRSGLAAIVTEAPVKTIFSTTIPLSL